MSCTCIIAKGKTAYSCIPVFLRIPWYSYVFLVFLYSCIPVFLRIPWYSLVFLGIPTYSQVFRRIPAHVCMHIVECRSLRYRLKVKGEGSRTKSQKLNMIFFDFSHVFLRIPLYSSVFLVSPCYCKTLSYTLQYTSALQRNFGIPSYSSVFLA